MKHLFLALLSEAPTHGYDLLQTYENLFAVVLPSLNAGQICTSPSRSRRARVVQKHAVEQEGKPDKRVYELTEAGCQVLREWYAEPLAGPRIKDDFYLKLISAQVSGMVKPRQLIQSQRSRYLQSLHDLNGLALQPEVSSDQAKLLLIHGAILHLKADLEWLELCEETFK